MDGENRTPGFPEIPLPPEPPRAHAGNSETPPPGEPSSPAPSRQPVSPNTRLALILAGVLLGLCALVGGAIVLFSVADDTSTTYLLSANEERGVKGLSAEVFELGQAGDSDAFVALAAGDSHANPKSLRDQFQRTFSGTKTVDYSLREDAVQVLVDSQTSERIVVVRLAVSAETGSVDSGPLYMVKRDGRWTLTGLSGRKVEEDTF